MYAFYVKHLDRDKRELFDMQLNEPMEGQPEANRFTDEQEGEDFMNALGTLGNG